MMRTGLFRIMGENSVDTFSMQSPSVNETPHLPAVDPSVRFQELGLTSEMLATLERAGYVHPTPVQEGVIPLALTGRDAIGQARTGTGKTAAFVIPIWERLSTHVRVRRPSAVVLVPTRELATQVVGEFDKLSTRPHFRTVALVGGERLAGQESRLKKGVHVVVGTPGRVLDHIHRGNLDLSHVEVAVLDEADRMLDIGFRPDIEKILRKCPQQRQTLLLSATLPAPILQLAHRYMQDPERLDFSSQSIGCATIEQFYYTVPVEQKFELLCRLIEQEAPQQAIIFCRTRRKTDEIYRRLSRNIRGVGCIHGDMRQSERNRVMSQFRSGQIRYLVATDVVGRGIDVTSISHIINYDIPDDCDDYVHRVGRTGRMGREGVSYTFATPDQGDALTRIEMRIDRLLKRLDTDLPQVPAARPSPAKEPRTAPSGPKQAKAAPEADPPPPPPGKPRRRHRRAL